MMNVKLLLVSSLEKVFPDEEPRAFDGRVEGFLNESVSFQAAWKTLDELPARDYVRLHIVSPIEKHLHVRRVRYVPRAVPRPSRTRTTTTCAKRPACIPTR